MRAMWKNEWRTAYGDVLAAVKEDDGFWYVYVGYNNSMSLETLQRMVEDMGARSCVLLTPEPETNEDSERGGFIIRLTDVKEE